MVFILCRAIGSAQVVDTATYKHLVDYVNCKYAIAYIEKKGGGNEDFKKDFKYQKEEVWEKKVNSYFDIHKKNTDSSPFDRIKKKAVKEYKNNAKILWKAIDEKKNSFDSNWSKKQLIDFLIELPTDKPATNNNFKKYLEEATNLLRTDLETQIIDNSSSTKGQKKGVQSNGSEGIERVTITIDKAKNKENNDSVFSLTFKTRPTDYKPKSIKWECSNENVKIISDDNKLTYCFLLKKGHAKIKVTVDGVEDSITIETMSRFRKFMLWFSIIGLVLCLLVRLKFWNKLKTKKEKIIFYCIAAAFVIILLSALFRPIRITVFIVIGILVIGIVVNYFFKRQKKNKRRTDNQDIFTEEEETSRQKSKEPITINEEVCQSVFNWILKNDNNFKTFSRYILQNERRSSLWVKNSLKHPEIRKMLENEFSQIENPIHHSAERQNIPKEKEIAKPSLAEIEIQAGNKVNNVTTLYADSIFEDFFNRVTESPNEDTVFELHLQNAQNATFTIYPSAKQRIIKRPAFLDGCDKQVLINGQDVKIIDEGIAQLQADGKWKITKKLNVIIS
jgi:hypothetical protein